MHSCKDTEKEQYMKQQDRLITGSLSQIGRKLVVMSGKGGVGKSTVAVNLAVALARRGNSVGLMDVDLHGPSVPTLLGIRGQRVFSELDRLIPIQYTDNLKVLSIANLVGGGDDAVIWRGPMKIGAIRQFISDVEWGLLDFLVIDSPPGTGDEPLTIAQTIPGGEAVIVTTPQELSLADVRRCVNFCRQVSMPVRGIIENMSGFSCPHCGKETAIFKKGGGEEGARLMKVPFLGAIPLDPAVMLSSDDGKPSLSAGEGPSAAAFQKIVEKIIIGGERQKSAGASAESEKEARGKDKKSMKKEVKTMKCAIPVQGGKLCAHFGHCEEFAIVAFEKGQIGSRELLKPPPHEPGVLPEWLAGLGVSLVIAGGMGSRAQELFRAKGIEVLTGAPGGTPEDLLRSYLSGTLRTGENVCDH
ncbi:MAG: iron-sulfur cluster carrier protein MrpORP [Candidatus Eremiobacteraeota bacterium]|nr:iron-sulfur cluster carrier protein MrpORP [Candidatus Eremiobacteraeota bacterium]